MWHSLRKRRLHWGAGCGTVAAGLSVLLMAMGAFNPAELLLLDWRYRSRDRPPSLSKEIAIVGFDDKELRRFSPYPREVLAKIVRQLKAYGARLIVLDVILDERRPEAEAREDMDLIEAMAEAGNVILAASLKEGRINAPHPFFRAVAAGTGHGYLELSSDQVARWFRPVMHPPEAPKPLPSLSLAAWQMMRENGRARLSDGPFGLPSHNMEVNLGLPLDRTGKLRINFAPPDSIPVRPARELIAGGLAPEWFRNRAVFVGAISPNFRDLYQDPFSANFHANNALSEGTPGVVIHAQALSMLLQRQWLRDVRFDAQIAALMVTSILLGSIFFGLPTFMGVALAVLCWPALLGTGQYLFARHGLVIAESPFLFAIAATSAAVVLVRHYWVDRGARDTERKFSRYLHPNVVREIVEDAGTEILGRTQRRQVTILFSDIRSYTRTTAGMKPEEVVALLNEYFSLISSEVLTREGFIDKYIGDAMMAIFGMFSPEDDGALRAVGAAIAMTEKLRATHDGSNLPAGLRMGIGIHTGQVVAGDMGSPEHRDYTVIGPDVNLASRLEGMTKKLKVEILISQATYELVKQAVVVEDRGEHPIDGFEGAFRLYELRSVKTT